MRIRTMSPAAGAILVDGFRRLSCLGPLPKPKVTPYAQPQKGSPPDGGLGGKTLFGLTHSNKRTLFHLIL